MSAQATEAGRNIAEVALSVISPDGNRYAASNHNTDSVVVMLLGDATVHASRAIIAGRHLANRGIRVIASQVCKFDDDEESALAYELLDGFKLVGGSVMQWSATAEYLKTLDAPPELIIDAMGGGGRDRMHAFLTPEDANYDSKVARDTLDAMAWANKSKAPGLAIDCPFGVCPNTGTVEIREGEPAEIRARAIVSCGTLMAGILKAMVIRSLDGLSEEWRVYVVDMGINPALEQVTMTARGRHRGILFGSKWIQRVVFDAGT